MLKVKLTKLQSTHESIDGDFEGYTTHIPQVSYDFLMFTGGLQDATQLRTTSVKEVTWLETDRKFIFETQNSKYELQVLDDKDPLQYGRIN